MVDAILNYGNGNIIKKYLKNQWAQKSKKGPDKQVWNFN